jgi:hypothetical protein
MKDGGFVREVLLPWLGFALPAVALIVLIGGGFSYWLGASIEAERERIRRECESRGGHVSDGVVGSHRFRICVEADGSMPNVPGTSDTYVVPVITGR